MSVGAFDPDAIMRRVRAAANASDPAKEAKPLRSEGDLSRLAELASSSALRTSDAACRNAPEADAIEERAALCAQSVRLHSLRHGRG